MQRALAIGLLALLSVDAQSRKRPDPKVVLPYESIFRPHRVPEATRDANGAIRSYRFYITPIYDSWPDCAIAAPREGVDLEKEFRMVYERSIILRAVRFHASSLKDGCYLIDKPIEPTR